MGIDPLAYWGIALIIILLIILIIRRSHHSSADRERLGESRAPSGALVGSRPHMARTIHNDN